MIFYKNPNRKIKNANRNKTNTLFLHKKVKINSKRVFMLAKKRLVFVSTLVAIAANAQIKQQLDYFPLSDVKIENGVFYQHQQTDICYILGLDADRLLAPYLKEAGLTPKASNYTYWENTGLDGHIGGHYLSALALMYASTNDERIGERLNYVLSELKRCQDAATDGYISGVPNGRKIWNEIKEGNIRAATFGLNDRWVPLYNIHKIFNGLKDAYVVAHKDEARQMLKQLTDWFISITENLTDAQIEDMLRSEHGGLNEVFADVYAIEKDEKYLNLACRFSHKKILTPLSEEKDELTGIHANTQIPKIIGYERIAELSDKNSYHKAAIYFWDNVVGKRTISIGGNSVCEHFHPATDYTSMLESEQGPETCNTYNMLRLTKMLYAVNPEAKYIDYYERALFNHILSSQSLTQGGFVYFTPMLPGHYRVYSQPQTSFWCCVGSGLENHARYGEMIYAHDDKNLFVNLFISSEVEWKEKGLKIKQISGFDNGQGEWIEIEVESGRLSTDAQIKIRIPSWIKKNTPTTLFINDDEEVATLQGDYYTVNTFEGMPIRKIRIYFPTENVIAEQLPDGKPYYSFRRGSFVYATTLGKENQVGIYADDSRGGHIAIGPRFEQSQVPVLIADNITEALKRFDGAYKDGRFTVPMMVDGKEKNIELVPFHTIDGARYNVYFRLCSKNEYAAMMEEKAKREAQIKAEAERTVDLVVCGEQQPESDHFIEYSKCNIGNTNGIHWRETTDYFTYTMKLSNAKELVIKAEPNNNRKYIVEINGKVVAKATSNSQIQTIKLKQRYADGAKVTIKAIDNQLTPHILEVRAYK